jgi:hypothetical protein
MGMPRAVDQFSPERAVPRGITAWASLAAIASWHLRVSYAPSTARQCMFTCTRGGAADVLIGRDLVLKIWQHGSVPDVAAGDFSCPNFQCFFVNSDVNLTPNTPFRATLCPATHD